ncbi:MAG: hypothetical protein PF487_07170 [Bacteroidales bacterium]|jgi:hypothetical protein|nr:hypothetical protein [Bacteroidales bacterium]
MKKEEEIIIQIRLKEIEDESKSLNSIYTKIILGIIVLYISLVSSKIILLNFIIPMIILIFIVIISYMQIQAGKCYEDSYDGIIKSIKENNILNHKMHRLNFWEFFWYKRKFK